MWVAVKYFGECKGHNIFEVHKGGRHENLHVNIMAQPCNGGMQNVFTCLRLRGGHVNFLSIWLMDYKFGEVLHKEDKSISTVHV